MTAFSTPFPGSLSAGLNALSSPMGGSLPAPLLAQLLGRVGGPGGMPGSLAPQIPALPGGSRAAGPIPNIPPLPQPPQNNLLSLLGGGGSGNPASKLAAGANPLLQAGLAPSWSNNGGLFGGAGPLFGGPLQGPTPGGAPLDTGGLFGSNGFLASLFGGSAGAGAVGAAATDAPLAGLGDMIGFTAFL